MSANAERRSKTFDISIKEIHPNTRFPYFSEPKVQGCFSLDASRNFTDGPGNLQFCEKIRGEKAVNFNLDQQCTEESIQNFAIVETDKRCNENSQMKHMRNWINVHKNTFEKNRPDFVMRRGVILKILGMPYENKDDVVLAAMYKNGTIYLRKILIYKTTEEWSKYNSNARHRRFTSWGHNFEHFLLADEPSGIPDPSNPRKGECDIVFTAHLNQHKILYAAESDGIWLDSSNPINPKKTPEDLTKCQLIELKTSREMPGGRHTAYFRRNTTRKWWCQAFLGRVSEILVGFRNDAGIVEKLEVMQVENLAREALDWSPSVCFTFLGKFLDQVSSIVREDPAAVYVFNYDPKQQTNNDCKITVTVEKDSDKLLPDLI